MSNKQKYIVLPGGKECKPVNPYAFSKDVNAPKLLMQKEFAEFEANHPTYTLTEVMPEGEMFEGEIKYYYEPQDEDYLEWREIDKARYERIEKSNATDYLNRIPLSKMVKPLKAIEPVNNIKAVFDALKADPIMKGVFVDVVENKETVEQAADDYIKTKFGNNFGHDIPVYARAGFIKGANWQQSQSIEGIVGFVLEYLSDEYLLNSRKQFIPKIKSDIIKEYKK